MLRPKILAVLVFLAIMAPWRAMADISLLDPMQLLLQGGDSHDVFAAAIEARLGIPVEYADVVFWHSETGEEIPYSEIRNLIGPSRQDGVLELIMLAEALPGLAEGALPMDGPRLARMFDAAFLASMRRPPDTVAVEFFDTRVGPTGDLSGGVSGHSPLNQQPPASAEERMAQLRDQQDERHTAVEPEPEPEPGELNQSDWPMVDLDLLPRAETEQQARLAGDRLADKMQSVGLPVDLAGIHWTRMTVVVQRQAEIDPALEREIGVIEQRLAARSESALASTDPLVYRHDGRVYLTLVVFHAAGDATDAALEFRRRTESLGLLDYHQDYYRQFDGQAH